LINVTKTFLPPFEEYNAILKRAWDNNWITNRGELNKELEEKLKEYLQVKNIILTTNGTLPLQIAIKTLELSGEIITTPFSYVATTAVIVWENCTPVFVDIDPEYLTIDETKIEAAITDKTTAILATHVYGNACNIEAIEKITRQYNLKVIYDAAHCFGVTYNSQSIFNFGDISTCSFHATKLFHTGEGGAMFTNDDQLNKELFYHHNFGHKTQLDFHGLGINAKMSELQAAMGLAVLPYMDKIIQSRKEIVALYLQELKDTGLQFLKPRENATWNYSYFPVIFPSEKILEKCAAALLKENIGTRRYFYPSLNKLPYINSGCFPIAEDVSKRILCLPVYYGLTNDSIVNVASIILSSC
jgi:dTDP-4-amino-4,6-dideoxygalactose transaminase